MKHLGYRKEYTLKIIWLISTKAYYFGIHKSISIRWFFWYFSYKNIWFKSGNQTDWKLIRYLSSQLSVWAYVWFLNYNIRRYTRVLTIVSLGRTSWLLYFNFIPALVWQSVFCVSSSHSCELVCGCAIFILNLHACYPSIWPMKSNR